MRRLCEDNGKVLEHVTASQHLGEGFLQSFEERNHEERAADPRSNHKNM
jgi:hypothetical protein